MSAIDEAGQATWRQIIQRSGIILAATFAVVGVLSRSSIAQPVADFGAVDPVVEEPIRDLFPGRTAIDLDDVILPAGSDTIAIEAAKCGAMGTVVPMVLLLSLGLVRTGRARSFQVAPTESGKSTSHQSRRTHQ